MLSTILILSIKFTFNIFTVIYLSFSTNKVNYKNLQILKLREFLKYFETNTDFVLFNYHKNTT
jgi:hypothetical protein